MRPLPRQQYLLLIGEGNFSFAAGLCKEMGCETCITATCYDSEETVFRQALAKTNIQYLRDRGAEVRFCVDCTKLSEHLLPAERDFDRVYFNFPHCGRKAGVKKNRELLAKFFCSCAEVLAEKGEVHVALCRGQGGTPADQPMREWHNSWQVVAMAAEAGFILSEVQPFNSRDVDGYKCTGYRSQDKSFWVGGALTHIFTRSLPFPHPRPMVCQTELEGKLVSFLVPEIFLDKINRGFLAENSEHPVRTISEKLIDELGKSLPVQKVNCSLSLVVQDVHNSFSSQDAFWMIPVAKGNPNSESLVKKTAADTRALASPSGFPEWDCAEQACNWDMGWVLGQYYLRPSLLVSLHKIVQDTEFLPGTLLVLSGPAFKKCKISPRALPIFHEEVFICVVNKGSESGCIQLLAENLTSTLNSLLQTAGFKVACSAEEPGTADPNASATSEPQLIPLKYFTATKLTASDPAPKGLCVGTVSTAPWHDQEVVCVSLNLDLLAMHKCQISDWRTLWTSDERFLNQFSGGTLQLFKSFSLYQPSYEHDVSFWVPQPGRFSETQLHAVARCVSRETVVAIQLLDSFQHPASGQTSLCYRLTYQSCDRALTCQQVAAMQRKLRTQIQHCLCVTLR